MLDENILDENDERLMESDRGTNKDNAAVEDTELKEAKEDEKNKKDEEEGDSEELDDDEFEVEQILNVAAVDGEVKFQVRWKGYRSDEDSWEPEANLDTARLILDEYIASHQEKVGKAQEALMVWKKRQKQGKSRVKQRNRGKKRTRRTFGSESPEDQKEPNARACKRKSMEEGEDLESCDDNSDEDYVKSRQKRKRGYKAADVKPETKKTVILPKKMEEKKSLPKDLTPIKAKNAWLYDDADDADSDASDRSSKEKKNGDHQLEGNVTESKHKVPPASVDEQEDHPKVLLKVETKKKKKVATAQKNAKKSNNLQDASNRQNGPGVFVNPGLPEPKVDFRGVIQDSDGVVKVIYNEKGGTKLHVVSVGEACEIDCCGLVQHLINRCEFIDL